MRVGQDASAFAISVHELQRSSAGVELIPDAETLARFELLGSGPAHARHAGGRME